MANDDHKGSIKLSGAQETLLLTLLAREVDTKAAHPILNDVHAVSALRQVQDSGYDFGARLNSGSVLTRLNASFISLRARILDLKTEAFLAAHPGPATVLHLACGLDARSLRVKWQGAARLWIDADKPDVIELRRQVMRDPGTAGTEPAGAEYRLIDPSITEPGWLEDCRIPADRPVLVLMEGLTMYLTAHEVYGLLRQVVGYFRDRGVHGEIRFDSSGKVTNMAVSRLSVMKRLGTGLKWSLSDPAELEREVPGLEFQEGLGFSDMFKHDAFKAGWFGTAVRNIICALTFFLPPTWGLGIYSYTF